jgi:hypothetical protein
MSIVPHYVLFRRPQQSQAERYFGNFFNEAMRELGQLSDYAERMDDPYWMGQNLRDSQTLASAVGNVENTPEKFAVSVNVSQFRPDELKVKISRSIILLSVMITTSIYNNELHLYFSKTMIFYRNMFSLFTFVKFFLFFR